MSGRAKADVSAARWRTVWRKHEDGNAARAIARALGLDAKTVRHYLSKGRPEGLSGGLIPRVDPRIDPRGKPAAPRDAVIPGSVRTRRSEHQSELMTIRCGGCGHEQDVSTSNHTSRCRQCGRTCRFTLPPAAENVIPLRRSS